MKIWDFRPHQSLSSRFLVAGVVGHTQMLGIVYTISKTDVET